MAILDHQYSLEKQLVILAYSKMPETTDAFKSSLE